MSEDKKAACIVNGSIDEFVDWYDTDGDIINVSDGGILFAEGRYHWYGQVMQDAGVAEGDSSAAATLRGVAMYGSDDLLHWEKEGIVLACSPDETGALKAPLRFERPKILYNERTGQYVLWCHYVKYPGVHGITEGTAEAGLAVSDSVTGPYRFMGTFRPIDEYGLVKDCSLFQDEDGSAYFIYDRKTSQEDRCLTIVKLSDDYLSFTGDYKRIDAAFHREAPVIVIHDGFYYMITSGLSGWAANQARYFRSRSLLGDWEDMGDPCVDDLTATTFHSQGTNSFTNRRTGQQVFMAERHNTASFLHCSYIWLPIEFHDDHTLSLRYQQTWKIL